MASNPVTNLSSDVVLKFPSVTGAVAPKLTFQNALNTVGPALKATDVNTLQLDKNVFSINGSTLTNDGTSLTLNRDVFAINGSTLTNDDTDGSLTLSKNKFVLGSSNFATFTSAATGLTVTAGKITETGGDLEIGSNLEAATSDTPIPSTVTLKSNIWDGTKSAPGESVTLQSVFEEASSIDTSKVAGTAGLDVNSDAQFKIQTGTDPDTHDPIYKFIRISDLYDPSGNLQQIANVLSAVCRRIYASDHWTGEGSELHLYQQKLDDKGDPLPDPEYPSDPTKHALHDEKSNDGAWIKWFAGLNRDSGQNPGEATYTDTPAQQPQQQNSGNGGNENP